MDVEHMTQGWAQLADALLQRAALIARAAFDRLPSPLAGLSVNDEDVLRLLDELPGLGAGDEAAVADVLAYTAPAIEKARAALANDTKFASFARNAGLNAADAEVLAVLAAVDLDPRRQRLAGYLNDDVTIRHLTPFSLSALFADEPGHLRAVVPGGALARACLLEPVTERPWSRAPLRLAPFVGWRLSGFDGPEPDLPHSCPLIPSSGGGIDDSGSATASHSPDGAGGTAPFVVVAGPDPVRRLEAAARALDGRALLVTPPPTSPAEWDAVIRQAPLDGAAVVLEAGEDLPPDARARIEATPHLAWGLVSTVDLPVASLPTRAGSGVVPQSGVATADEVAATLGPDGATYAGTLTADQLRHAGRAAAALDGDVAAAIRRLAAGHIDRLATRTTPRRTWDDLVLRQDRLDLVKEVGIRYRHRRTVFQEWGYGSRASMGVIALFAGESGTGKTLSAEIIAGDLGQDLYTVDLSQMVSKYVGETEKNLSAVFEAAEASPVVLFFDEADALIGKRSSVSDAHDRYANIEVAYLLQRIERHNGVVVLATNLASNIDQAFIRRIHVAVDFPMPEAAERLRIWQRSLPPQVPTEGVTLEPFAQRFEIAGGAIRNAALTAGFLAAEDGGPLRNRHLVEAVVRELRKMGRRVREEDLAGL
ncbi:MAG: ATP-binding protein [Actinomycetes bacterium]